MPSPRTVPAAFRDSASGWERALYAFLAEKERRSGSRRTVESYSRMLQDFFGRLGKTPDAVTSQDVFVYAHGIGRSGREPSSVTVAARAACVSSFYRFLMRMGSASANPCDVLERPKSMTGPPRGLSGDEVRRLLEVIPATPAGLRDRAIVLTLVLTGRRRSEVLGLTAGDLSREGGVVYYTYRGKGGKRGRREMPRPAYEATVGALAAADKRLEEMSPVESIWPGRNGSASITSGTFYVRFRSYLKNAGLPMSGVHVTRHTAAKLRRDAGESIEAVSAFLDHSSLATTTVYLRRLEGQQDGAWRAVASALGIAACAATMSGAESL